MLRKKLVLAVAVGAASFGGAAFAATHGASHPVKKPAVHAHLQSNVHYPCHNRGAAKITTVNV